MPALRAPLEQPSVWNALVIGGVRMPGVVQEAEVGGGLLMNQEPVSGRDGVVLPDARWSEDTARFTLRAHSGEDFRAFERIRAAYKNRPGARPRTVEVLHPLLQAFGARTMILSEARLQYSSDRKWVTVTIGLTNIAPKAQKAQGAGSAAPAAPTALLPSAGPAIPEGQDIGAPPPAKPSAAGVKP